MLLANRSFLILFSGQFISTIGNSIYIIAMPWFILVATHSTSYLALAGFLQTVPNLIGLFVGVVVDRFSKKSAMIFSDVFRSIVALMLFWVSLHSSHDWAIVALLSLVFLLQLIGTLFSPAQLSYIPFVVDREQLTQASGINQSGSAFAQLVGTIGGGWIIGLLGAPLMFFYNGVSFIISVISLLFIKSDPKPIPARKKTYFAEWKDGIQFIFRNYLILRICLSAVIANFVLSAMGIILAAWVNGPLQGTSLVFGILSGAELLGVVFGGLLLKNVSNYLTAIKILLFGPIVSGVCLGLIGFFTNFYIDMVLMFISGYSVGTINGSIGALLMKNVPENVSGRVFATFSALNRVASPVGVALIGICISTLNLTLTLVLCGLCLVGSGCLFAFKGFNYSESQSSGSAVN